MILSFNSIVKMLAVFIFHLIIFVYCTSSLDEKEVSGAIVIEINKMGQFILDGKEVSEKHLEEHLLDKIEKAENYGYQRSEITADLRVHPDVKMSRVSFVQTILRNVKIKKVLYSYTLQGRMT